MRKIALVGGGNTKILCPYGKEDLEIWAIAARKNHSGCDRLFEIHRQEIYGNGMEGLINSTCPVYMQSKDDRIPQSIEYPVTEMREKFGNHFSSSAAYMFALALHEGVDELYLYGLEMVVGSEYEEQRPDIFYFLGLAEGMGVKVHIPKESLLIPADRLYGYTDSRIIEHMHTRGRIIRKYLDELYEKRRNLRDEIKEYEGMVKDIEYNLAFFGVRKIPKSAPEE